MAVLATYTKIKIISLALDFLGKGPIDAIAGSGDFAEAAGELYDLLYPSLITEGSWRFAVKTGELSLHLTSPEIDEWEYAYQLPVDYLACIKLEPMVNYMIYGRQLYTNYSNASSPLYMEYYHLPDEENLPPYFVRFFTYQLAADFAWSIARDKSLAKLYEEKAHLAYSLGSSRDAQSHPSIAILAKPYIDVRAVGASRKYGV